LTAFARTSYRDVVVGSLSAFDAEEQARSRGGRGKAKTERKENREHTAGSNLASPSVPSIGPGAITSNHAEREN